MKLASLMSLAGQRDELSVHGHAAVLPLANRSLDGFLASHLSDAHVLAKAETVISQIDESGLPI